MNTKTKSGQQNWIAIPQFQTTRTSYGPIFKWQQHIHTEAMPEELRGVQPAFYGGTIAWLRDPEYCTTTRERMGVNRGGNLMEEEERRGEKGKEAVRRQSVRKGS
jgi:hypothetical protein